jgi:hypothetical protein
MKRRIVPSRLVPDAEHPELRTDFRHPDLEQWVRHHRGQLLAAVLTIWRNWIVKDRPEADTAMGSFDRWARAAGGALEAAGIKGFRTNTIDWLSDSEDDDGWSGHLAQLRGRFRNVNDGWFTVGDVAEAVDAGYLKRPPLKRDPDKSLAQSLAYAYRGQREKWHGALRLVRSRERDSATGGRTWSVQCKDDGSEAPGRSSGSSGSSGQESETPGQQPFDASPDDRAATAGEEASSVTPQDRQNGETAGQPPITDHTDHTDHRKPRPAPVTETGRRPGESPLGYAQRRAREQAEAQP